MGWCTHFSRFIVYLFFNSELITFINCFLVMLVFYQLFTQNLYKFNYNLLGKLKSLSLHWCLVNCKYHTHTYYRHFYGNKCYPFDVISWIYRYVFSPILHIHMKYIFWCILVDLTDVRKNCCFFWCRIIWNNHIYPCIDFECVSLIT